MAVTKMAFRLKGTIDARFKSKSGNVAGGINGYTFKQLFEESDTGAENIVNSFLNAVHDSFTGGKGKLISHKLSGDVLEIEMEHGDNAQFSDGALEFNMGYNNHYIFEIIENVKDAITGIARSYSYELAEPDEHDENSNVYVNFEPSLVKLEKLEG